MFIDRSALLQGNSERLHYGICVTDIDGDGHFEWFVAGFGVPNRAYKWTGQDYQDIAPRTLADARRQALGLAACDIDANGREEIYVLNTDTFGGAKRFADRLFAYGDSWVDLFELPQNKDALNLTSGRSVVAIDRNGNGLYGLFVANYGGPMRLYELDDDGILRDVAPEAGLDLVTGGRGLVALPIVSNRMDIFAGNEHGPNFLFRNKGDGTFEEIAAQLGIGDPFEHVRGIAVLDTNSDGRFDLVYGNWEGPHRMFVQSTDGIWDDIAPPEMAQPSRIRTVIAADFDNDGYEELFFNNIGEPNRLFALRDGDWESIPIGDALEPDGLGTGAAVADTDGDGRLELLIAHGESSPQPLSLYHTVPNLNHYLRVLPLTRYGAPARGAIVMLQTSTRIQRRAIDAGSGYLCQMEPVAHFGLGQEMAVERVIVHWPDGRTYQVDNPLIDQLLRVPYPTD
ncbi:CRTAC1 family protein [Phototrophicus methaneseepsis]|uniref:CRTAC1 family protein n=1 Tax=Phototrophicus methaneseepsis TaxID=2710758 RepID=A0A7S8IG86_9CHLR|nr:CRTAC1 family protein [Phototrophicus methaneseepsis]QPC84314.1 CRTAC1 family protein [Phototrophicus methaneseepsis]